MIQVIPLRSCDWMKCILVQMCLMDVRDSNPNQTYVLGTHLEGALLEVTLAKPVVTTKAQQCCSHHIRRSHCVTAPCGGCEPGTPAVPVPGRYTTVREKRLVDMTPDMVLRPVAEPVVLPEKSSIQVD